MNRLFLPSRNRNIRCAICGNAVALENSKADEHGSAVHEECYVGRTVALFVAQQDAARPSRTSTWAHLPLEEISATAFYREANQLARQL